MPIWRRDGGSFPAELSSHPIFDRGVRIGTVVVFKDTSQRLSAERALRRSEEYFRSLIENAREFLVVLDLEGNICYSSPSFEKLLGISGCDLLGRPFSKYVHPDDGLPWRYCPSDGGVVDTEMRICNRDGEWHFVEGSIYNRVDDPVVGGIILNVRDVTDRKLAEAALQESERQLRQTQKMDAIGKLAGGVAHDFNNLVTAILGYSQLLMPEFANDDRRRDYLREIQAAGERAATLTRQLLSFSRHQMVAPRVIDVNEIVATMERMLRRLIGEDVGLITTRDPALSSVKADPGQIEQILLNLAVNARDAMPQGGELFITTANVEVDAALRRAHPALSLGPHVMIAVQDTGCGMDEDTLGRIFEPFFTTKEVGKGTGLGLSTVYGIVSQAGGAVSVSSTVGKGTIFRVYLPVSECGRSAAAAPQDHAEPGGSETILLVEDELSVRKLASAILRRSGYEVLEAADGVEALRICREYSGRIDLLLTDVVMPKMSGRVLAEHVRSLKPEVKTLYASGYTDDAILRHGVLVEQTPFLSKPFRPALLKRTVREVLDDALLAGCTDAAEPHTDRQRKVFANV